MKAEVDLRWKPHDIVIEQELLGCILLYNESYQWVSEIVRAEHFFEGVHSEIFDICAKLIGIGRVANPITLKSYLPEDYLILEGMNVSQYMAKLAASATTIINVRDYATIVRDLADYRAIINVAETAMAPKTGEINPVDLATEAIDRLDAIVAERTIGQVPSLTLGASVVRAVDAAAKAFQTDGAITGMSYGLSDLDWKTSGLQRGELTIIAGRPGMMKTGLALNVTRALCQAERKGIFFSLEMGDESLSRRLMSDMIFDTYELPHFKIKSGRFAEKEFEYIQDAAKRLQDLPLRIEQQTGVTLSQMSARARQMKRRQGLDFMVVDHMGHVMASDRYAGNKVNEIGEVSTGLLRLARELDIGMIALCQLNRGVESREDKRPNLSDLRASGNIEEDAAVVMMVYREAYYLSNREPRAGTPEYQMWQIRIEECWNKLNIIIEKQRDGSTGSIEVFVDVKCNAVRHHGWTRDPWPVPRESDMFS